MPRRALRPSADRILDAAEALFAKEGYATVSLRQLIAAAGVSTTAFYARFDGKAAVLAALIDNLFAGLHREAAATLGHAKNLEDGIDRGVDLLCAQLGPRQPLVRLVLAESGVHGAAARSRSYALLAGFLAHRLRALAERGRIGVADPDALAWAIVGALEIHVVRWAVWNELTLAELRTQLRAAARAILPKEPS